jgi:hypothetical protein
MERLEGQASVARQYREYNDDLTRKQQLLWLLRRNEAQLERERLAREIEQASIDLEARTLPCVISKRVSRRRAKPILLPATACMRRRANFLPPMPKSQARSRDPSPPRITARV